MKICQIMLNPGFGGAERIFVDTCLGLAEEGQQIFALVHPQFVAKDLLQHSNIQVIDLKAGSRRSLLGKVRLYRLLKELRPDVVHLHLRKAVELTGRLCSLLKIPVVASMHNYGKVKVYSKADRIIALTPGQVSHITQGGYPKEKVEVIPNFSKMEPLSEPRDYQSTRRYVAYGRFVKKKGFAELLEAVALAKAKGCKIQLTLGGAGEEEATLRQKVQALQLDDQVHFYGWVDDVRKLLDENDIFVLPSLSEPFGIVLLEAMARRLPIISTLTEGPKDFLTPGMAWLCKPKDSTALAEALIATSLASDSLLKEHAELAFNAFKASYVKETVVSKLISLYKRV